MIYFQDDVFGYNMPWLAEFAEKWRTHVGLPWHCQIRLELTNDTRRLDLFQQGGCTGITVAIESGNEFLRRFVLCRHMDDPLIVRGIGEIKKRGFALRTEQILAVPFSSVGSDLSTLELNCRLKPEMAWTSILAPYAGTAMGAIASNFGIYTGHNDDLKESYLERSVLRHLEGGYSVVEPIVRRMVVPSAGKGDSPLLRMRTGHDNGSLTVPVFHADPAALSEPLCHVTYLDHASNERYADQTVMLQRLFNWLSLVPDGHKLGATIVGSDRSDWTWQNIGLITKRHFEGRGESPKIESWAHDLARRMGMECSDALPTVVRQNPCYFAYFPGGEKLAAQVAAEELFTARPAAESFDRLGVLARRHLFIHSLYKLEKASEAIASR